MRSAFVYNFLIEANIMASIAIILMIPLRKFFRKQLGNSAICFGWLLVAIRLLCPLSLGDPSDCGTDQGARFGRARRAVQSFLACGQPIRV